MFDRITSLRLKVIALAACSMAIASTGLAQQSAKDISDKRPAFAVVSVRQEKTCSQGGYQGGPTANGYQIKGQLIFLIYRAYGIKSDNEIAQVPQWANSECFNVEVRLDDDAMPAFQKLSLIQQQEQSNLMLQQLLEDRFGLKTHYEQRMIPVYNLVVAKGGPKLTKSEVPVSTFGFASGRDFINCGGTSGLIRGLSNFVGRTVIDKTGLTEAYDIKLKFAPMMAEDDPRPSIFTALQEQLGLKLESAKSSVDVLVIDHLDQPTPN